MGNKTKVRAQKLGGGKKQKEIMQMFYDALGMGELNLPLASGKYARLRHEVDRFIQLVNALSRAQPMQAFPDEASQIKTLVASLRERFEVEFPDIGSDDANFPDVYAKVKDARLLTTILGVCSVLSEQRYFIENAAKLNSQFLTRAGMSFAPFAGEKYLNFKWFFQNATPGADQHFFVYYLHKLYLVTHEVFNVFSSPDVDVAAFADVVLLSVDEVKKHIPRCDEAFNRIKHSVALLQENFGAYYREYITTNNPSVILSSFIADVAKGVKVTPVVASQFGRICAYYNKMSSQMEMTPCLKNLQAQLSTATEQLQTEVADYGDDGDDGDDGPTSKQKAARQRRRARAAFDRAMQE